MLYMIKTNIGSHILKIIDIEYFLKTILCTVGKNSCFLSDTIIWPQRLLAVKKSQSQPCSTFFSWALEKLILSNQNLAKIKKIVTKTMIYLKFGNFDPENICCEFFKKSYIKNDFKSVLLLYSESNRCQILKWKLWVSLMLYFSIWAI